MLDKINSEAAAQLHLDLMKKCLTRYIFFDPNSPLTVVNQSASILLLWAIYPVIFAVQKLNLQLCKAVQFEQGSEG